MIKNNLLSHGFIQRRGGTAVNNLKIRNIMDNFEDIRGYISNPRLSPYLDYCESNKMKALILYQMNLRLSAAFLPIISMLEVALRNAIDSRMTKN